MQEFKLAPEEFGLVRMGRKRSIIGFDIISALGEARIGNIATLQAIKVEVFRTVVTRVAELTQADAETAGYLYLHQLTPGLMRDPDVTDDTPIFIIQFRCPGDAA